MLDFNDPLFYQKLPALNLVREINELCNPLFQLTHANYFDYNRIYNDNSFITLTSDGEWLENFFRKKYVLGGILKQTGIHLMDGYYYSPAIHDFKINFNRSHGVSIFYQTPDYLEYIDIAAPCQHSEITSIYLNRFDIIENFIHQFKVQSQHLITKAESHKVKLTHQFFQMTSNITGEEQNNTLLHRLSNREKQCLRLFLQGKTAKETASILQLSHRTIEEYLRNIKIKLQCARKRDLLKFHSVGLFFCSSKLTHTYPYEILKLDR